MAEAPRAHLPPLSASPSAYLRAAREIAAGDGPADLHPFRLALLSSAALQPLEPFVIVAGARRGLRLEVDIGPFGQLEQAAEADGHMAQSSPDAVVLFFRLEDIAPDAVWRPFRAGGSGTRAAVEELVDRLVATACTIRSWTAAPILVANFAPPGYIPLGVFDAQLPESLAGSLGDGCRLLRERLAAVEGAAVWDYAGLVTARGTATWSDPRLETLARVPIAAGNQPLWGDHLTRTLVGMLFPPAKCLVLDLDNTLWGGVIGDDGLAGIQLGDDYPGNAFKAFQRTVLGLADRGILLALCSKNQLEVVEDAFRRHPDMVISWEDVAAARINWSSKSQNILEIAGELNIGADALVLFDDNPVERAEVRAGAPEVRVVEVPDDPLEFSRALLESGHFDAPAVSAEDRTRAVLYRADRGRQRAASSFADVKSFLTSLEMEADVGEVDAATLNRVSQLIAKTNQFNLTTRRHSSADVAAKARDPDWLVAWLRLRDRFGDQGLVAVGLLHCRGDEAIIDTFLMSCRVMSRGIEDAFLAYLADHARAKGCRLLVGEFRPTAKNVPVKNFYPDHGFVPRDQTADASRFELELSPDLLPWPSLIRRVAPQTVLEAGSESLQ